MLRLAVIGHPIAHSLSPQLFQAFGEQLDIEIHYEKRDVPPEELADFMVAVKTGDYDGLNVTLPHKAPVMETLDGLEPEAEDLGAVNCVYREGNRWIGANTDWRGFLKLLEYHEIPVHEYKWVILGAGGVAHSVVYALYQKGLSHITVINRTAARTEALIRHFQKVSTDLTIQPLASAQDIHFLEKVAWVNATSLGMPPWEHESPLPLQVIESNHFLVDTVYIPQLTTFIKNGFARGVKGVNGVSMFIYQGLFSLEHWLKRSLDKQINVEEIMTSMERYLC